MFGFLRKNVKPSSFIAFDLLPLFNSLTPPQKVKFEPLANSFHFEVHREACVMGYTSLLECWVAVKQYSPTEPVLLGPNVVAMLGGDASFAKEKYQVLFPVSELESVKALSRFVSNDINPPNQILSQISGECAINILKGKFVQPKLGDI